MSIDTNPKDIDSHSKEVEGILALQKSEPVRAFNSLQELAPRSVNAMLQLGWAYQHGLGTGIDVAAAEECYRNAAEAGSPTGLFNVGVCYEDRKEYPQALEFYTRAAARGHAQAEEAKENLPAREAYQRLRTDPVRTHDALRRLAEHGSTQAMVYLAWTYRTGCGTATDPNQAERWYQRAFDEGTGDPKVDAAYYLGLTCQARADYAKAREYFKYGCDQGEAKAVYRMAKLYARGLGVERNPRKARLLYEAAACLGSLFALRDLAWQDLSGRYGLRNFLYAIPRLLRFIRRFSARVEVWGDIKVLRPEQEEGSL